MSRGAPWQVLADCPHCRTEAGVVELMDPNDPQCAAGIPSERRCRMCGWQEGVRPPANLRDASAALAALQAWAVEEGEPDVGVFARGSFGAEADEVVARLVRGDAVPTTFDVIAFLFPSGGAASIQRAVERTVVVDRAPETRAEPTLAVEPEVTDPRTPARVLVSVMVADGTLRAGERRFIVQFLEREGLPPLAPDDLRVWRPSELGPVPEPAMRDRVLEAAVHLMHLDRERDGSEWRVVRTFARAWGVDDQRLDQWDRRYDRRYSSAMGRLGQLLVRLFGGS